MKLLAPFKVTPRLADNLIFLHIPKNGGNTLHSIIKRVYPSELIFDIEVINNTRLNTQEFIALPESKREKIKILKGHMLYGLHKNLVGQSQYITLLRKPEKRILSFYNYVLSQPDHYAYHEIKNQTFNEFVRSSSYGEVHNGQVRWISGLENEAPEIMLQKALENIHHHFSFVGLLEEYDTSLVLLSDIYNWGIPFYKHGNRGVKKTIGIDADTLAIIQKKNAADYALYDAIVKQFKLHVLKKGWRFHFKRKQLDIANQIYRSHRLKKLKEKLRV